MGRGKTVYSRNIILLILWVMTTLLKAQLHETKTGQVDVFMGAELNYRDINFNGHVYDILVNLTPGVKWNMGNGWQAAAQAYVPVYNDYGDHYKKVRLNMAVISNELHRGNRWFMKLSGGLFGQERYGLDWKGIYVVNRWLALEAQTGWTGFCSMAVDWEASTPGRWTALGGADLYLSRYSTQLRLRGGRFIYEDIGWIAEAMRHFDHCTVGAYVEYSDRGGKNGGFKIVMMIPPYHRKSRRLNIRPASNFRLTYNQEADSYSNKMYITDPEENEREGWFDREIFRWGANIMASDFLIEKEEQR